MFKFIKKFYKRQYVKWRINAKYKWLGEQRKITDTERMCLSICRNMISHKDSKFLIAPLSRKRYIKNDHLGLFVILDERTISITNHVYHYDVRVSERDWDRICQMYDSKTEKIRLEYESEIMTQIQHSLTNLHEKIKNLN